MSKAAALILAIALSSCSTNSPAPPCSVQPQNSGLTMMGDSIVAFWCAQPTYPAPFNASVDLGVFGATTSAIKNQIAKLPSATKWVLIDGGINDLVDNQSTLVASNYMAMLDAINAPVVVIGILHFDPNAGPNGTAIFKTGINNAVVDAMNANINAICATHANCTVATAVQALNMSGLTIDGVHPSSQGYAAIMAAIARYL